MTAVRSFSENIGPLSELLFRLRRGPAKTWRWISDRLRDSRYDAEFGISSSPSNESKQSELECPEFVHYQAVSYSDMREILERISIHWSDIFVDFGSGMGRAVCLAATYPFRAVIGVEISPELSEIARRNLNRVRHKLESREVRIVECNATAYDIPDTASVFFFFNPFRGSVLAQVLQNIARSLQKSPRRVRVLFYGTVSSKHFRTQAAKHEWLHLSSETVLGTGAILLLYRNAPPS